MRQRKQGWSVSHEPWPSTKHHGITVNAVAPGWIATLSQLPEEAEAGRQVPLRRSGTPAEVASAMAWLASPGASYITGQVIIIEGGNSISEKR